jgi:uncharacterized protein with HEPN domain
VDFVLYATSGKDAGTVFNDPTLSRAVVRSLEIIGEASKKLRDDFKHKHANIEWRKLAGTRDKLIHEYFGVDYEIVWDIIVSRLPELQYAINEIFKANKNS